jgi:hypothetical protein
MKQMGMASIDELLDSMIKLTDAHRLNLKTADGGFFEGALEMSPRMQHLDVRLLWNRREMGS